VIVTEGLEIIQPGLACVAEKVRFHRRTIEIRHGTNTNGG
jgi:hypothetical protein